MNYHGLEDKQISKKILITGSSGFIGGRFVEKCFFDYDLAPICHLRNYKSGFNVARFPFKRVVGNINDLKNILKSNIDIDYIVHCAIDNSNLENNVNILRDLISISKQLKIKKFIQLSSYATYLPSTCELIDENSPPVCANNKYAQVKNIMDDILINEFKTEKFPCVILQPTIVYGPYSYWIDFFVEKMIEGTFVLPNTEKAIANLIYIDDLCDAILKVIQHDCPFGEKYIINGNERITWIEYFGFINKLINKNSLTLVELSDINKKNESVLRSIKSMLKDPLRLQEFSFFNSVIDYIKDNFSDEVKNSIKNLYKKYMDKQKHRVYIPNKQLLELFCSTNYASPEKINQIVHFSPQYSFHDRKKIIVEYIQWKFSENNIKDF